MCFILKATLTLGLSVCVSACRPIRRSIAVINVPSAKPHETISQFLTFFRFLTYSPELRISAYDAIQHEWFRETPKPVDPSMFPTWPAKSEMTKKREKVGSGNSPKAPAGAMGYNKLIVSR